MDKKLYTLTYICLAGLMMLAGCIKNDLPYPRIQQNILQISADGESKTATIDSSRFVATVYLNEWVDIKKVSFKEFEISPEGTASPDLSEGTYDLSTPLSVELTRYQTYQWIIKAEQQIERYFTIEGQIGESVIDVAGLRVIVNVPDNADLSSLTVESIKLGPERITTYNPVMVAGNKYDFIRPFVVSVNYNGIEEEWTIYVQTVASNVSTESVDAWSRVIWAYGTCASDKTGSFQYKEADKEEWIDVDPSWVTQNSGALTCRIPHLQPLTEYVVRAVVEGEYGNEITATTQETADLPDGSFDQWWLKNNKVWCPWDEGGTPYWDTGNTGAATLGQSNVVPTEHTVTGTGRAAELNTRFVGILGLGKLGAGSIYTGSFKKVDGTNGILDFGREWKLRPTKLRGYYQYKTATIDYTNSEWTDLKGRPDSCHIYVALTDWTAPYEIRTNPNNRQLFNKDADYIIAYGELIYSGTMDDYEAFEITLDYKNTYQVPTYLQITCAASKYGDFFTGGNGAVLYVDEFSFDYDY